MSTVVSTMRHVRGFDVARPLSIGIPKEYFGEGLDPEVGSAVQAAIDYYKSHGA